MLKYLNAIILPETKRKINAFYSGVSSQTTTIGGGLSEPGFSGFKDFQDNYAKRFFGQYFAIEIHSEIQTGNIRHVVFDFDGTISLIRDGWQNQMVPMMVECLQTETDTTETQEQLEALVVEFVDRLTGKQTIYQMIQLSEEIENTRWDTAGTARLQR